MIKFLIGVLLLALLHGKLQAAEISTLTLNGTDNNCNCICPPQACLEQAHANIRTSIQGFINNFVLETYDILQECHREAESGTQWSTWI